jgi:hypothetical protein
VNESQDQPATQPAQEQHQPGHVTMLEKMRSQVKDKKKTKLAEYCFIIPAFI